MNLRRILSQAALIIGTLIFAIGLQAYAQTFTQPSTGPTNGNAVAPLDTGSSANFKAGELIVNLSSNGQIGSAIDGLVAGGNIVATNDVCSQSSGKCLNSLGGGITGVTAGTGLSGGGTSGNVTLSADYGGSFEEVYSLCYGLSCAMTNPSTNSCSCPSGYNSNLEYNSVPGGGSSYNLLVACISQGIPYTPFIPSNYPANIGACAPSGP